MQKIPDLEMGNVMEIDQPNYIAIPIQLDKISSKLDDITNQLVDRINLLDNKIAVINQQVIELQNYNYQSYHNYYSYYGYPLQK